MSQNRVLYTATQRRPRQKQERPPSSPTKIRQPTYIDPEELARLKSVNPTRHKLSQTNASAENVQDQNAFPNGGFFGLEPSRNGFDSQTNRSRQTGQDSRSNREAPSHVRMQAPFEVQAHRPERAVPRSDKWRQLPEVTIHIRRNTSSSGLPINVTTLDLWKIFSAFGNLQYIEVFTNTRDVPDGGAKIQYKPPPDHPFWEARPHFECLMSDGSRRMLLQLELKEESKTFSVTSPVNPEIKFPERFVISSESMLSIDFGFMFEENTMMKMFTTYTKSKITFEADLKRRWLSIKFSHFFEDPAAEEVDKYRLKQYRFRIPFIALEKVYQIEGEDSSVINLLITLDSPPSFWRKIHNIEKSHEKASDRRRWSEEDTWFRQTDIVFDPTVLKTQPIAIKKKKPTIDIGRWTTYLFKFKPIESEQAKMELMFKALKDFNVDAIPFPFKDFKTEKDREWRVWDIIDRPIEDASTFKRTFAEEMLDVDLVTTVLSYPVRYQLEVCISQGILSEFNLTQEFISKLVHIEQEEEDKAVRLLELVAETGIRYFNAMDIFKIAIPLKQPLTLPSYCILMRKATITPAMVYYSTPTVETSNRVIRQYHQIADRFLRVQFTDEKFSGKVSSTEYDTSNEIFTRVKRAMTNAIVIGERRFEFLAFGNSQLRSHGAYFFCPTDHITAASIRKWMGDFQSIRQTAKYAARLGQCFSTTRAISTVRVDVQHIPDIERNGICFSDGCGQISPVVAQFIASELKLPRDMDPPSCYQFRLSGCKGVLAVNPSLLSADKTGYTLPVCIRETQRKFNAEHNGLEIIRWSQFASATLNRQLIILLSTLGVDDVVFMRKLKNQLRDLEMSMTDSAYALSLLRKHIDANGATLHLAAFIIEGFMQCKEPFIMNLLHLWRAWSIKALKEKARIVLDEGAFVIGVVDETAKLKGHYDTPDYNNDSAFSKLEHLPEIFLQISDVSKSNKYKVIEGVCLLARNPSLHPGDIRTVRAVACPELMHLRNVVVLPQTGTQSLASMCSGGDLDGDDYIVVWDKDFTPTIVNHTPMDYTPPTPFTLDRDVEVTDISSFFVNYMKNDKLGTIAHSHLAQADKMDEGVMAEQCIALAGLHSRAVDYNKSGVPAVMEKRLKVHQYPHFMEKFPDSPEKSYRSRKVLGQLYDAVDRISFQPKFGTESDDFEFDERILHAFSFDDDLESLGAARGIKFNYDEAMRRIMAQHAILSEHEIYSTFVLQHASVSNDYKFHEEIQLISQSLRDRFVLLVEKVLTDKTGVKPNEYDIGRFAAAMYIVTNDEYKKAFAQVEGAVKAVPVPLISFPWIFHSHLSKIANGSGIFRRDNHGRCVRGLSGGGINHQTTEDNLGINISGLTIEHRPYREAFDLKAIVDLGDGTVFNGDEMSAQDSLDMDDSLEA